MKNKQQVSKILFNVVIQNVASILINVRAVTRGCDTLFRKEGFN